MPEENAGLGGALSEAVAHLKGEPLLSFGIAAVIVIGIIATVGAGTPVPVVAAVVVALAVLAAWVVRGRGGAEAPETPFDQRADRVTAAENVEFQSYEGPAAAGGTRVKQDLSNAKLGPGVKAQSIKVTSQAEEPPKES
ncbi:MAG TPA: hypothetical protein VF712_03760 [Thermoleophilaceae bacterium]|jgi:hypothetical protein